MIIIDKNSKKPLYLQIYEEIFNQIQEKELTTGDVLIPTRVLAKELGVSRNTVDQAYSQLVLEGLVVSKRGSGYIVAPTNDYTNNDDISTPPTILPQQDKNIVFDFNWRVTENRLFRHDFWRQCITHTLTVLENRDFFNTPSRNGEPVLQHAITKKSFLFRRIHSNPDDIVLTPDIYEALSIIYDLFDPKEYNTILTNPTNPAVKEVGTRKRFNIKYVDITKDGIDLDQLYKYKKSILCVKTNHHFPTGVTFSTENRMALLKWANDTNSYIIEDDSSHELIYTQDYYPSLKACDTENRVFYAVSYSVTLSPGSRLAFFIMLPQFSEKYNTLYEHYSNPVPIITQYALTEYIEKKYLLRHRRRYRTHNTNKNRIILEAIKKYFDDKIEISGEKAGLYLVVSPKNNMTEEQLISSALKFGIKVYPISKYYNDISTAPKNSVIIGYSSVLIDNIEKGIALLYKAWFE